ncbi:hypothetical protein GOV08_01225 [Candidatus Woesearchaeota archaeon]|nr:hypothetical protein [Candidatus Woesearchaeota archaeon]
MKESLDDAREELKRVDHMIFVSLKYTRTVDVLINILKRMIDAYDFAIEAILRYALENNLVEKMPTNPVAKVEAILNTYDDEIIRDNMELYQMFKKIVKAPEVKRINEYRRHVTLRTEIDRTKVEIHIDNITEYYNIIKEFVVYINNLVSGTES